MYVQSSDFDERRIQILDTVRRYMRIHQDYRHIPLQISDIRRVRFNVFPHNLRLGNRHPVERPYRVKIVQKIVHPLPKIHILGIGK